MATTTSNTNQLTNTPQAGDDYYGWTEDQLLASGLLTENNLQHFVRLDVMSNDLGGNAKKLWSIDDGNGNTNVADYDLVKSDMQGVWEDAAVNNLGVADKITISNGAILLDLSESLRHFGAANINGLAAGDHIHDEFVYAIHLANGALSQAKVTIDIWGQNDTASISGDTSGSRTEDDTTPATGTLTVVDPDHGQSHTQCVTNAASDHGLGTYSVDADGHWSYTVNNALVQHLAAGETTTDSFTVNSFDGTATQTVTITITGTNDAPVITSGAQSGAVSEGDGQPPPSMSASGQVTFSDADTSDTHSLTVSAAAAYGTASVDADGTWHYAVSDSGAVNALAAGEHLADSFTVQVDDHHGGLASQVVNITITGTNDAPVITSGAQSGAVSEGDGQPLPSMSASGQVTFSDADTSDTHSLTVSAAAAYGTASVDADGTWHYTVSDSGAVNALAAGEHLADSFTVQVDDHHGGLASQVVNITITGTNDAPVITSGAQSGAVSEGDGQPPASMSASGQVTFSDADTHDSHSLTISQAAAYGTASVDADGTWHYTVSDSGAVNALATGEHLADSFTVQVDDHHGG